MDRPTTLSLDIHKSSILILVIESFNTANTIVVAFTQLVDTEMPATTYILVLIIAAPLEQEITLALPQGGIYFDG